MWRVLKCRNLVMKIYLIPALKLNIIFTFVGKVKLTPRVNKTGINVATTLPDTKIMF